MANGRYPLTHEDPLGQGPNRLWREQIAGVEAGAAALQRKLEQDQRKVPADPWIHRSDNMRCKTCIWFVPKQPAGSEVALGYDLGRCRRHAPTMGGYPVVFVNDWCGDHRLDENKLR